MGPVVTAKNRINVSDIFSEGGTYVSSNHMDFNSITEICFPGGRPVYSGISDNLVSLKLNIDIYDFNYSYGKTLNYNLR